LALLLAAMPTFTPGHQVLPMHIGTIVLYKHSVSPEIDWLLWSVENNLAPAGIHRMNSLVTCIMNRVCPSVTYPSKGRKEKKTEPLRLCFPYIDADPLRGF
jgi:hypothetical protein